jgi:uncharacterized membrane protein
MANRMKPSSKDKTGPFLYWSSLILAVLGAADAIYLTVLKYTQLEAMCVGNHGCITVNNSPYGSVYGIPVAILGLVAYLFIGLTLVFEPRWRLLGEWGPILVFGAGLVGVLYSAYLTYLEFAVIHAFCPFCLASAIIITIIFVIAIIRLVKQTTS